MNKQQRAVERIKQMEEILDEATVLIDELDGKLKEYERLMPKIKKLEEYYTSKLWKDDLALDEAGKLPADLKRGVLSEDAVYDLIIENRELVIRMLKLTGSALENNVL